MRRITFALALTAAATAATVVLSAGSSVGDQPQRAPLTEAPRHYTKDALSARLTKRFGVLRRAATAADKLPSDALRASATYGSIPDAARKARNGVHGPLYVIPGVQERVCLMASNGGGGCNHLDTDGNTQLVTTIDHVPWLDDGQVEIQGLVPDGVRSVTVTLRSGASRTLNVINNVYDGVLPGGPKTVIWSDGTAVEAPWMP